MKDKEQNLGKEFNFSGDGLSSGEKRWATIRFNAYRNSNNIGKISDLELLSECVFREALQIRTKKQIGKFTKSQTTSSEPIVPTSFLKTLDENLERIILLKKELGLLKEDKEQSFFDYIKQLKEKFKIWRSENEGSRQITCPFCSKIFYLMIRTDKYKAVKGEFFKDKILSNKYLWLLYKQNKITKEDVSKVLGTSTDYIDWLEDKIYSKEITDNPTD